MSATRDVYLSLANLHLALGVEKLRRMAWDETKHPRHPAGSSRGGEFAHLPDSFLLDRLSREIGRNEFGGLDHDIRQHGWASLRKDHGDKDTPAGRRMVKELERRGWKVDASDKGLMIAPPGTKDFAWDESKYQRGKTTAASRGGSFAPKGLPPFRKGKSGLLERHITPEMLQRAEAEERRKALESVEGRRTKRIERLPDWPTIERMARRDGWGLGGTIEDVWGKRDFIGEVGGAKVAAIAATAFVSFPAEPGFPGEIMRGPKGESRGVSDGIDFVVYRDPKRPSILRFTWGMVGRPKKPSFEGG